MKRETKRLRPASSAGRYKEIKSKLAPWLENKIERVRSFSKPYAARAARYGTLAGVSVLLIATLYSFFLPKDRFQLAKERVLKSPNDFEAHLILAEEFLKNNQLKEAKRELLVAQQLQQSSNITINQPQVLGLTSKLEELYLQWQEENPEELRKLISKWEKIVAENPTYRDGYLRLTLYYFKLGETEKAKENLNRVLELDPNFEPTKELEKILGD